MGEFSFLFYLVLGIIFLYTLSGSTKLKRDEIEVAKLFDPSITTFRQAQTLLREKYRIANKYERCRNLQQVVEALMRHEPESFAGYNKENAKNKSAYDTKQYSRIVEEDGTQLCSLNLLEMGNFREQFKEVIENTKNYRKKIKSGEITYPENYTPPKFKYIEDPIKLASLDILKEPKECFCCKQGKTVFNHCSISKQKAKELKTNHEEFDICLECIQSGEYYALTNEKINLKEQIAPSEEAVTNKDYNNIFENCTIAYSSWQDPLWLTHCGDYCKFIKQVYWQDIVAMGKSVEQQIVYDYIKRNNGLNLTMKQIIQDLREDGPIAGYLFQCVSCGTYRLFVELA
jgi:uncharacterized protein CbrC (UPF0167 family)